MLATSQMDTYRYLTEKTGKPAVYPGHPLVLAVCIIRRFKGLADATRVEEGANYPSALTDSAIPGAGGEVYQALEFLRQLESKEFALADAPKIADEFWVRNGAGGHSKALQEGIEQARRLHSEFAELYSNWGNQTP